MRIFGDTKKFAIAYEFRANPFNEKGYIGDTWGCFQFWLDGKNICAFNKGKDEDYEWNLIYLVEWFCENSRYILEDKSFPLPAKGTNFLEMYNNSGDFDSDDDDIFDEWFKIRQEWNFKHSWYCSNEGSFLPEVFFSRVNDTIEIVWDNTELFKEIKFIYPKGLRYISINKFKEVIECFLKDFIREISQKDECVEKAQELYESLIF